MPLLLACASHTPLMDRGPCSVEERERVAAGFLALGKIVQAFDPELIVQFSPDHFNGFGYALMPAFCVGSEALSVGDFDTHRERLDVPSAIARRLAEHLLADGMDIAVSHRMRVDHGFVQIWQKMFGSVAGLPIVPIFINCAAPPLPTTRRARLLGEAVGRFAHVDDRRVLIVASGGLSHDPPLPQFADPDLPPAVRERLVHGHEDSDKARAIHAARIFAVGQQAYGGLAGIWPVSESWDRDFLEQLREGPPNIFDDVAMADLVRAAGHGGAEVLCWIAAVAALRQGGAIQTELHAYEALQGWIAGVAVLSGRNSPVSMETVHV